MKFLVDAQLPRTVAVMLKAAGHDASHTLDLPNGNATTDAEILRLAHEQGFIIVTKDADFLNSYHLKHQPRKLLLISTGNISNSTLANLLDIHLPSILEALQEGSLIELTRVALIVHD